MLGVIPGVEYSPAQGFAGRFICVPVIPFLLLPANGTSAAVWIAIGRINPLMPSKVAFPAIRDQEGNNDCEHCGGNDALKYGYQDHGSTFQGMLEAYFKHCFKHGSGINQALPMRWNEVTTTFSPAPG